MTAKKRSGPTHRNAVVHAKIMAALSTMGADARRQALVDAGILTKSGKLTKRHRSAPVLSYRETEGDRAAE